MRTDRPNAIQGGGTAILISNKLKFKEIPVKIKIAAEPIEITAISLNCINNYKLIVIAIYAPRHNNHSFIDELDELFAQNQLRDEKNLYIIAGDFNSRHKDWGDTITCPREAFITNWLINTQLENKATLYTPSCPTYKRADAESYIDLCIADSRIDITNLKNDRCQVVDYDSNHKALL